MSVLFPCPAPSYAIDSFPGELIWVPKKIGESLEELEDDWEQEHVPCLLLTCESARFLVIFFHSNAEDLGRCRWFCLFLRDQFQVHVLAIEYPGYGVCPGVATHDAVMENANAALTFVTDVLNLPLNRVKLFGRSIGTGLALQLAAKHEVAGLILVTPFRSVRLLFQDKIGPLAMLVEEWFSNDEAILKVTSPTMIIHGRRDMLVPWTHGEALYNSCTARKLFINPAQMEHNTNLTTDISFLIVPMFRFFTLPDYIFQELKVPQWIFDKRRSPYYVRPLAEVCSYRQVPLETGKVGGIDMPGGDNEADTPVDADQDAQSLSRLETFRHRPVQTIRPFPRENMMLRTRTIPRSDDPMTHQTVRHSTSATKDRYTFMTNRQVETKASPQCSPSTVSTHSGDTAPSQQLSENTSHEASKPDEVQEDFSDARFPRESAHRKPPHRSLTPVRELFSQPMNLIRGQTFSGVRSVTPPATPSIRRGTSPFRSRTAASQFQHSDKHCAPLDFSAKTSVT